MALPRSRGIAGLPAEAGPGTGFREGPVQPHPLGVQPLIAHPRRLAVALPELPARVGAAQMSRLCARHCLAQLKGCLARHRLALLWRWQRRMIALRYGRTPAGGSLAAASVG